jgi:UDP-glucose 4-epimerase
MAGLMGRPLRLLPVPEKVLRLVGMIMGRSAEIDRLCGSLHIDISKAKRILNWEPPLSVNDGLRQTIDWYKDLNN